MYSEVELKYDLTQSKFGYSIDIALPSQPIVAECKNCNKILFREKRNIHQKHRCVSIIGDKKRCAKCGLLLDFSFFNKSSRKSGGVGIYCRKCVNSLPCVIKAEKLRSQAKKEAFENDPNYYFKNKIYYLQNRSKYRNFAFDLNAEYLKMLYQKQNGKCYYTNIDMSYGKQHNFQKWNSASIDRIKPELGYVKDNIVWCIFAINSFKQNMNLQEFDEVIKSCKWWNISPNN